MRRLGISRLAVRRQSMVRGILVAGFAAAGSFVPVDAWAQAQAQRHAEAQAQGMPTSMATIQERTILLEFFEATGGARWKQAHGWGTASDPCMWQGVVCLPVDDDGVQRMAPTELHLTDNGLTGAVPVSLLQLRHLKRLDLAGNRITAVPQEVLTRADANRLELGLEGNPVPEILVRLSLRIEHSTGMCMPDQQVQFAAEFDGATRRARYQALFCSSRSGPDPYCLAAEPYYGSGLDLVSRGLRRLGWKRENQRHHSPAGVSHHEEDFRATLAWGGGTSQAIWISGGHAPIDIQIGQQLIRSLVWPGWTTTARRVKCDTLRW